MTKPSILVVGSSNTDMIIKVQRIPQPGETILGGEFALAAGGKGANDGRQADRFRKVGREQGKRDGQRKFHAHAGMNFGEGAAQARGQNLPQDDGA
ncbi:MAG TPA: hypothetical protein PK942_10320, partial [Verrucomicrobiota bacterium]|nr:hypothetical protein [Verrucomicrobiota bacterium]